MFSWQMAMIVGLLIGLPGWLVAIRWYTRSQLQTKMIVSLTSALVDLRRELSRQDLGLRQTGREVPLEFWTEHQWRHLTRLASAHMESLVDSNRASGSVDKSVDINSETH